MVLIEISKMAPETTQFLGVKAARLEYWAKMRPQEDHALDGIADAVIAEEKPFQSESSTMTKQQGRDQESTASPSTDTFNELADSTPKDLPPPTDAISSTDAMVPENAEVGIKDEARRESPEIAVENDAGAATQESQSSSLTATAAENPSQPEPPAPKACTGKEPPPCITAKNNARDTGHGRTKFNRDAKVLKGNCAFEKWKPTKPKCESGKGKKDSDYNVWGFEDTFERMRAGMSISRYGDGELRLMEGHEKINRGMEVNSQALKSALMGVAQLGGSNPKKGVCVGLVEMFDPKKADKALAKTWAKVGSRYSGIVKNCFPKGSYCSASITRPDHWSDHSAEELIAAWAKVFDHRKVLYVRPSGAAPGNVSAVFAKAKYVWSPDHIIPSDGKKAVQSFAKRDQILSDIVEFLDTHQIDVIALSVGPTASILVGDLACMGVQTVDFGSMASRAAAEESKEGG